MLQTLGGAQKLPADVRCGDNCKIFWPANVYNCTLGDNVQVGAFVTIQRGVIIGSNVKIMDHAFICDGVTIMDGVFIGAGVIFCNDREPRAIKRDGTLKAKDDWIKTPSVVGPRASIGAGAVILPGVRVSNDSVVGAGAVVTRDVPAFKIVIGNPARVVRDVPYNWGY